MATTSEKTSFLQSLLPSTAKSEKNNVSHRIKDIEKNIIVLQKDVCEAMGGKLKNFEKFETSDQKEFKKCVETLKEIDDLSFIIDNEVKCALASSTQELMELKESLKETTISLSIISQLLSIKTTIDEALKALSEGRYVAAASHLQRAKNLLDNPKDSADQLHLYGALKDDWSSHHSNLMQTLYEVWGNFFSWDKEEESEDTKTVILKILNSDTSQLKDVVEAFHTLFESSFYRFGKSLLQNIFIPIITQVVEVNTYQNENNAVISLKIKPLEGKPNVTTVMKNVTKVTEFLSKETDISLDGGETFLKLLGSCISKEFSDSFIKECLMTTLPSSKQEMDNYSVTLDQLRNFVSGLQTVDFLETDCMLEFVERVDVLSVDKACAVFLEKARDIMKKDLHDAISIGPENPSVALHEIIPKVSGEVPLNDKNKLAVNLQRIFSFPACRVSIWTLELLKLTEQVLEEAVEHNEEERSVFYQTARNIFILYLDVVPVYHEKFLETIPQLVALFHNNCMYLAHRLLTLGFEHQSQLSEIPEKNRLVFIDLVQPIRSLGSDAFLTRLQHQRKSLLDLTKDSGLATIGENPKLPPTIEKSIRKCLRQLEHLNSVWRDVLPVEVYNKAIGGLLDAWLSEIIARVCSAEDMSASAVQDLVRMFTIIIDRAPKVFKVPTDIAKHVKQWSKFKELIQVFGCTLKEIEERWMQGAGTLAYEFTAEQVKHLIRALFQNTEVRASVLARIE